MVRSKTRKKKMKTGAKIGIAGLVLMLLFVIATIVWVNMNTPVTLEEEVAFSIEDNMGAKAIAQALEDKDIIKSAFAFRFYVSQTGIDNKLKPGNYSFGPGKVTYGGIVDELLQGNTNVNTVNVTIPEGYTVLQIAEVFAKTGIVTKDDFLEAAKNFDISAYFYIPNNKGYTRLEGFLFPDTYNIAKSWTSEQIIGLMLKNFDKKLTTEMRKQAEAMNMSIYEIVTMASIVEREARQDSDRPIIAGVFYNRLSKPMRLESCATVQYILGDQKAKLTTADTKIDDPYNTYRNDGLPPGPIAVPGLKALEAALYPEENDYYFFLAKPDGYHYFSKTLDEHNAAKAKYLN
ncbi:MAG: endolytic transglycosylase MltG [Clostridia bacterium]|jgi:UPF0755 protein|nr:endolytic transglycosylase MltG [Clostridia bacterium]